MSFMDSNSQCVGLCINNRRSARTILKLGDTSCANTWCSMYVYLILWSFEMNDLFNDKSTKLVSLCILAMDNSLNLFLLVMCCRIFPYCLVKEGEMKCCSWVSDYMYKAPQITINPTLGVQEQFITCYQIDIARWTWCHFWYIFFLVK